jgi:hypothetical protein
MSTCLSQAPSLPRLSRLSTKFYPELQVRGGNATPLVPLSLSQVQWARKVYAAAAEK